MVSRIKRLLTRLADWLGRARRRDAALRKVDVVTYAPTRYRCVFCDTWGRKVRMFAVRDSRDYLCLVCGRREHRHVIKESWPRY